MYNQSNDISLRRCHEFEGISEKNMQELLETRRLLEEKGVSTGLFKEINQFLHGNPSERQKKELVAKIKVILNQIIPDFNNRSRILQGNLLSVFYSNLDTCTIEGGKLSIEAREHVSLVVKDLLDRVFPALFS